MKRITIAIALLIVGGWRAAQADTVDNAFVVCKVFDSFGYSTEKCKVSGYDSSVNVTVDMTPQEARLICSAFTRQIAKKLTFNRGWTFNIYSPYSSEHTIAFCPLPTEIQP